MLKCLLLDYNIIFIGNKLEYIWELGTMQTDSVTNLAISTKP